MNDVKRMEILVRKWVFDEKRGNEVTLQKYQRD